MSIKHSIVLSAAAILFSLPIFADDMMDNPSCGKIVKACKDAGFSDIDTAGKRFWQDCMKPVLMGKAVSGVTVDANDVKTCRTAKIKKLSEELKELQSVK